MYFGLMILIDMPRKLRGVPEVCVVDPKEISMTSDSLDFIFVEVTG